MKPLPFPPLVLLILSLLTLIHADPPAPDWIWKADGERTDSETIAVSRSFSITNEVKRATLRATADFAGLRLSLNGREVLALDPYDPPGEVEVTRYLVSGENHLTVDAVGVEGPSAFGVTLEMTGNSGGSVSVRTDRTWLGAVSIGPVESTRWALNHLPEISPFSEYNQWREAIESPDAVKLSPLPPGFDIKKIRDAAEGEDSWVSLVFDSKGRLFVGKEQKGILRLTLSEKGDEVVSSDTVEDTLKECRGLAWIGNTLYAQANNSKALHALRDTDGDARFDEIKLIGATEGGVGHGRNALAVHEGKLYGIVGDDIAVPAGSPRRAPPERGAPAELGHSFRVVPEGENGFTWESLNRGLRNPYGIAFNEDGEAFTYDADNEGDIGLPFYRPTRIHHLVSGANYGWHQDRGNTRNFPIHAPDSVPGNYDVGRGSPTGVKFGTRSHFPSPWRESLFALDWAYGRIVAIHLTPHGASYHARGEVFLEGRPLNVTDLDFDGDGAMWFVTGGRKTKSALYRVRYTGDQKAGLPAPGEQEVKRIAFSERSRELRKQLERFHGEADGAAIDEVWPHLGSPDPWIRNAARVALEWQPVADWRGRALAGGADLTGLTAMLALARAGTDEDRIALAARVPKITPAKSADRITPLTFLRIHELSGAGHVEGLATLVESTSEPVQRELARALIRVGAPESVDYAMARLASAENQSDRLHYLEALSEAKSGWSSDSRHRFFTALAHARRFSDGDRYLVPFFEGLETTALSQFTDEPERNRYAAMLQTPTEIEETAPTPRPHVNHWTLTDFENKAPDGDPVRGRELYTAALCAKCHVCGTVGRPVGPDLSTVASRFSRRDLLESILDPSAVVSEVHRNVLVVKRDETMVQGRIVQNDFRESKLILATNPFVPDQLVTIPKGEIFTWEESPVSPMPPALLDTFTKEEIGDLLAFLLSGGKGE